MSALAPPPFARPAPPFSAPHVPREFSGNIPPCNETLPVLKEVFAVLKHDWIRNFLFTPDPVQVTVLTSLSAAFAVNVVFHESSVGRAFSSTDRFSVTVDGETVLVPAFTHENFSLGVGIKKRTSDIPKDAELMPWTGQLTSEHLRFVADTSTGSYFVVRHSRHLPFVFIEVFTLRSPVHRSRTVLTFHVSKLYDMVRRYDFESFPLVVHNALALVQVIHETRECNVCGSVLEPQCRCVLKSFQPQHPLDFEAMKKNLSSHFGAFQGAETLNLYTAGAQIASAELGARFSVVMGTDPKRTQDLIFWAVNDRMVAECPGPLRQLTPVSNDEPEELFGYFGDLDHIEEEEVSVKKKFKREIESESRRASSSSGARHEGRSPSPEEQSSTPHGSTPHGSTEASDRSTETPESATRNQESDKKDPVIVHKDPEKLAKIRLRREKNREAARRSNLSKKLKNEEIRQQLAESIEKMNKLQEKEAALRVENSRLRKLASGSNY